MHSSCSLDLDYLHDEGEMFVNYLSLNELPLFVCIPVLFVCGGQIFDLKMFD